MKRLATILLTAIALFALSACDTSNNVDDSHILSEQDIFNSVLSSIEQSFDTRNNHETYTMYNFINDKEGFFFHFGISNNQNQLILFMKTLDGGKTWFPQGIEKMPSTHQKERIISAKMVNDSVGLISAKFHADNESVSRRIFITTNGGITWDNVQIPYMGTDTGNSEVYDIKYEDGRYILCFRTLEAATEQAYAYFEYTSIDLVNWTLSYDIEIPYSLDNELSQDNESQAPSAPDLDISPDTPKISITELSEKLNCAFMNKCGNNLERYQKSNSEKIYAYQEKENSNVFHVISKHGDTEYKSTVTLSDNYKIAETYSGFTSELEGYVIIINVAGYAVSPMDAIELKCVLKTHDGGVTWEAYEYDAPMLIGSREYVSNACFITDKIGFCTARYYYTDDFSGRTFWTLDGGKNWFSMSTASSIEFPDLSSALGQQFEYGTEIKNLEIKGGACILTVRICHGYSYQFDDRQTLYIQYASKDLVNWTLISNN